MRGVVADLTAGNAVELLGGADVILDGTDNFDTRYLINDFAVSRGIPWIYGAAVGSYGLTMPVIPGAHGVPALRLSGAARRRPTDLRNRGCAERDHLGGGFPAGGRRAEDSVRRADPVRARITTIDVWEGRSGRSKRRRAIRIARRAAAASSLTWKNRGAAR